MPGQQAAAELAIACAQADIDMAVFDQEFTPELRRAELIDSRADVRARAAERRQARMAAGTQVSEPKWDRGKLDTVGKYLSHMGDVPLLTAEEEVMLAQTIERGKEAALDISMRRREEPGHAVPAYLCKQVEAGKAARDHFIRANLRLVVNIASRYPRKHGMDLMDYVQEGNLGLEHAVGKFEWRYGFKFSTYATRWIQQAIGNAINNKASLIRVPVKAASSLRAALRGLETDDVPLSDYHEELFRIATPSSLDMPINRDGTSDVMLGDTIADPGQDTEDQALEAIKMVNLEAAVGNRRHAEVLRMKFGLGYDRPMTDKEIAARICEPESKIRRIILTSKRAVAKSAKFDGYAEEL